MAGNLAQDLLDPATWRASPQVRFPGAPSGLNTRSYPADTGTEDCWIEGQCHFGAGAAPQPAARAPLRSGHGGHGRDLRSG